MGTEASAMIKQLHRPLVWVCSVVFLGGASVVAMSESTTQTGRSIGCLSDEKVLEQLLLVAVEQESQQRFFDELRRAAQTEYLTVRIAPLRPSGEVVVIQICGKHFEILGTNSKDNRVFRLGIYPTTDPLTKGDVSGIIKLLENVTSQIDGAVILTPK